MILIRGRSPSGSAHDTTCLTTLEAVDTSVEPKPNRASEKMSFVLEDERVLRNLEFRSATPLSGQWIVWGSAFSDPGKV
jgi:hypothetical protein